MSTSATPTDAQALEAKKLQNRLDELQSKQEDFNKFQSRAQNNITRNERLLAEGKVTPEYAAERKKIANQEIAYYNAQIQKNQEETAQIQSQLANLPRVQAPPVNSGVTQSSEAVTVATVSAPAIIQSTDIDTTGSNQGNSEPAKISESSQTSTASTIDPIPVDQQFIDVNQEPQQFDIQGEQESRQAATAFFTDAEIDPATDPAISAAYFGQLGINTDITDLADLGELGINTDLRPPTETELGELGINTALSSGELAKARASAEALRAPLINRGDWRVRLQLAPGANYLYAAPEPGILKPLQGTGGVLFPYLPAVSVVYSARYDDASLTHTNYKILQYTQSSVDNVQITGDFTAQSTEEANYLLAVIHFFRTITKMFYGQDNNPRRGTPPPLVYLTGYGEFQYSNHPLVITSFGYSLPTDVDYIRAGQVSSVSASSFGDDAAYFAAVAPTQNTNSSSKFINSVVNRVRGSRVPVGGLQLTPQWAKPTSSDGVSYVPTKISISVSGIPVVSRADVSREFSVRDYATGKLTRGRTNANGRGFW